MEHHGLSSSERFPTDWTAAGLGVVIRIEVSVQSLGEGCSQVTEVTLPRLVVLVVSVHVVHQPSESSALLITQLTDTKFLATL